jgi:hypothetical protein
VHLCSKAGSKTSAYNKHVCWTRRVAGLDIMARQRADKGVDKVIVLIHDTVSTADVIYTLFITASVFIPVGSVTTMTHNTQ